MAATPTPDAIVIGTAVRPVADGVAATARWLLAPSRYHDPRHPDRTRRPLRLPAAETHEVRTDDGVALRLARFRGAGAPVMLSHCIGVSSRMYLSDTQPTTLTEYLHERGYDVWLLDHRLSIELPASGQQSKMDDLARFDYPAAIAAIREVTHADGIHIVAHGVGSSTFTMALLAGLQGVRSAVCSQVSTHLRVPFLNRLKTETRSSTVMARLGRDSMTTYTDATASSPARAFDRAARLYPIALDERCLNPVCHRITMMYGELYEH
ncbi:MAG: glucose-methanol-choline oxidoreductase, partial [Dehalococcoidia bacterium]